MNLNIVLLFAILFCLPAFAKDKYIIETIPPIRQFGKELRKRKHIQIPNYSQYTGEHSAEWHKKSEETKNLYFTLGIEHLITDKSRGFSSNKVFYPSLGTENNINYQGEIDFKGNLGLDMSFGQQHNFFRYDVALSLDRLEFASISKNSLTVSNSDPVGDGSYTEDGPVQNDDINGELNGNIGSEINISSLSFNIYFHLASRKRKIIPYIGAGYGVSVFKPARGESDIVPLNKLQLGFLYTLKNKSQLIFAIKYYNLRNLEYKYDVEQNSFKREYSISQDLDIFLFNIGYKLNHKEKKKLHS